MDAIHKSGIWQTICALIGAAAIIYVGVITVRGPTKEQITSSSEYEALNKELSNAQRIIKQLEKNIDSSTKEKQAIERELTEIRGNLDRLRAKVGLGDREGIVSETIIESGSQPVSSELKISNSFLEKDGIRYVLEACKRIGNSASCELNIRSLNRDRRITVGQKGWVGKVNASPLRDDVGNRYIPNSVRLANQLNGRYVGVQNFLLVADISTPLIISYDNLAINAKYISRLEIGVRVEIDGSAAESTIQFNNVSFSP